MYKKLIYLIIGVILLVSARASTNVSIGISSTEDINIWANPNTPGETTYYLDGVNFKDTVNDLYNSDMNMKGVYWRISRIFMNKDYKNEWFIVNPLKLDRYEQRFRWVLDNYFVPRTEVNQMNNYYESRITDLSLRLEALEKILGEKNVLKGRLNVAKDYDLPSLTYNNKTYHKQDDGFVSLKTIEQPEINETEEVKEAIVDLHQNMIDNWQRMCDRGITKWCIILEKRGY